ncbi:MAG: hypothetical protein LBV04_10735 [Deferribacteraceae bacterium]|jgi:PHD/YefM family antitoxin component YafN of YafNO toxin-antitoxin module|nr:hypothetical protein [Deferribacteraceae bacterium]
MKTVLLQDLKSVAEIGELCQDEAPVYLTKQGEESLVIMTQSAFERLIGQSEIIKRQKSAIQSAKNKQGLDSDEVFARLEEKYG